MNVEFCLKVNIRKNKFCRGIFYSHMMASVLKIWLGIDRPKFFNQRGEAKTAGKNGAGSSGSIRKHLRWIKNENRLTAPYPPHIFMCVGFFGLFRWDSWDLTGRGRGFWRLESCNKN